MYTIIKDTREQLGWEIEPYDDCAGMETAKLDYGDYAIKGYPDLIVLERKATPQEVAENLGRGFERFENELIRLQSVKYKYLMCEFSFSEILGFPKNSTVIPQKVKATIKMNGKFMVRKLMELQIQYNIPVLFCGSVYNAESAAKTLFRKVYEEHIKPNEQV